MNNICRYARRLSSVLSTPIESKRFLIVPVDSSAARIPLPGATSACAVACIVSVIAGSCLLGRRSLGRSPGWCVERSAFGHPPTTADEPPSG